MAGAKLLAGCRVSMFPPLKLMGAVACCGGNPMCEFRKATAGITLEIVKRTSPHSFQVIRRRWVVERTFGWLMRYRRLARDYERTISHHEAMVYWATVLIMTKQLTQYETAQCQPARARGKRQR